MEVEMGAKMFEFHVSWNSFYITARVEQFALNKP